MAGESIGTIRGTIEIDYDGAGIVRAVRDTDKLTEAGGRLDRSMSGVLKTFGKFAKAGAIIAASSLASNSALQAVAGTLAILAPLTAAGIAVLPGIMLGAAAAGGILKVATIGVGDALSAAAEDTDKFNKAIENLAPNAQKFARAYRSALPALNAVKNAIQDAFFRNTAGQVNRVVKSIQSLRPQAVGIAGALNRVVANIVKFVTSGRSIENIRRVLSGTNGFLLAIQNSIGPVVQSFLGLAGQAGEFGQTMGTTVANALAKVAQFLQGINLRELFANALPIVQALGVFLTNIASIAGNLFSVFNVDGANAAGVLGELAGQLAAFLNSAQGQEALAAIGQAMGAISSGAGQVFLALLQALAPTLVALAPAIESLANSVSSLLVSALEKLTPLLVATATFISNNINVLGPLAAVIIAAAAAYKVYVAVTKAWAAAEAIAQVLRLRAVAGWIANTAATIANTVATAANAAIRGGVFLASWIATTAAMIAQRAALVAYIAVMAVVRAATIAWTVVQTALSIAVNSTFIIIIAIIVIIALLVAGIVLLWQRNETFRKIVLAVWDAVKKAIKFAIDFIIAYYTLLWNIGKTIFNAIKTFIIAVWSTIAAGIKLYINTIRTVVTAVFNFIKAYITTVFNAYKAIATAVWNAITAVIRSNVNRVIAIIQTIQRVVGIIRNAFNSAKNAVSSVLNAVVSVARSGVNRVIGVFTGLAGRLYDAGRALIQGFVNGIRSMIGAAKSAAKAVVNAVTGFLPGSPAKEGPLAGRGYVYLRAQRFMADWARGMNKAAHLPVEAMAGAVVPVASNVGVRASTGASGASTAATTTNDQPRYFGPYQMEVDGKVLSEFVVDTVTGNPEPVAKAAKEGDRRNTFAHSGR